MKIDFNFHTQVCACVPQTCYVQRTYARMRIRMKNNLLIIEDDKKIRRMIKIYFQDKNYNCLEAEDGASALMIFQTEKVDIVFLDIMIPELDGLKVCSIIRETSDVPIIMLTAKSQEEDKIRGFEYGADEYVTKPFSLKVLAARAEAMLKRVNGEISKKSSVFQIGGLKVNKLTNQVTIDGININLTKKEYDLLQLLIQNKGLILSKQQILDRVWGYEYDGDPRTVDTHMKRLREKLKIYKNVIKTSRGRGYFLEEKWPEE